MTDPPPMERPKWTDFDERPGVDLEKRAPAAVAPVLDGEVVERTPEPQHVIGRPIRRQADVVVTQISSAGPVAAAGRVLRATPRRAMRASWTSAQGGAHWATRAAGAATHRHLREQLRLARLAGDAKGLGEWSDRLEKAKDARLQRVLAMPRAGLAVAGVVLALAAAAWLLVLLGGVIASLAPGGLDWAGWWSAVGGALSTVSVLAKALWSVALVAAAPLLAFLAWREGRRVANPPLWLLTPDERNQLGSEVTPSKVITALRDLGISTLRAAIKEMGDAGAGMLSPIVVAGCGVEVDARLPSGVSTAEVLKRRKKLAENLDRHEHEVFPVVSAARTVRVWIADSGALDEPIGPSPLATDTDLRANYRTGRAPWGQNLRGDATAIALYQRHVLITGMSNQGKTAALRALALWLAFDAAPVFRIADLKGFGDWSMFGQLAEVLIEGPTDDHVIAATEMLEAGVAEMERRLAAGVTEPPLWLIVDEAQVAYMCPVLDDERRPYGGQKATSRFFMAARKLHNQGRAVNVVLWQGTQDPTDANLPKIVREGAHIRASLVVGTPEQAEMALGAKAVDGGAAPHLLRQGLDKGTLVVSGDGVELPSGQASITIRTHFVDTEAATEIALRAVERRRRRGRRLASVEAAPVDHLADIRDALRGEQRVRTTVVLARLIEAAPDVYESWDLVRLSDVLTAAGAPTLKTGGLMYVVAERVLRVVGEVG